MEILLAQPRGFCAGVDRAIKIVERALAKFGKPIYVRHEIVHNTYVVDSLKQQGAIFVNDLSEVPANAVLVFSAHGAPLQVHQEARQRGFHVFDATCPLVTKVHVEVAKMHAANYYIIMIGHAGHPEVEGTMGQLSDGICLIENLDDVNSLELVNVNKLAYVTQTTLSVDETMQIINALKQRFPHIIGPKKQDICFATQNRQDAIKFMAPQVQAIIVVGSQNSSNSNRLRELSAQLGVAAYLVESTKQIEDSWFVGVQQIGVTAGASAPETLVQTIIEHLKKIGVTKIRNLDGITERVLFPLPKGLA